MRKSIFVVVVVLLCTAVFAQGNKIPLIGSKAPVFSANTTNGKLTFPTDFGKSWKILFSHPADFTPVCSTELLDLAYYQPEFDELGIKVAVISVDNLELHQMWKSHLEELNYKNRGPQKITFPILEDQKATAANLYGMLHEKESTERYVRGVFIIDSEDIVRSVNFYPMQIGRNISEITRTVEALQKSDADHVLTPANWNEGDDVMVPNYPYTKQQLADNPNLKDDYYSVGNRIWFKKANK